MLHFLFLRASELLSGRREYTASEGETWHFSRRNEVSRQDESPQLRATHWLKKYEVGAVELALELGALELRQDTKEEEWKRSHC